MDQTCNIIEWQISTIHLTLKMTSAQVVETPVTKNSSFQNYPRLNDHTIRTTDTPGFKPLTIKSKISFQLFPFLQFSNLNFKSSFWYSQITTYELLIILGSNHLLWSLKFHFSFCLFCYFWTWILSLPCDILKLQVAANKRDPIHPQPLPRQLQHPWTLAPSLQSVHTLPLAVAPQCHSWDRMPPLLHQRLVLPAMFL